MPNAMQHGELALILRSDDPQCAGDLTGVFCTSGSEREFTLEERWRFAEMRQQRDCAHSPQRRVVLLMLNVASRAHLLPARNDYQERVGGIGSAGE
jgi:hypothetical protein